MLLPHRLLIHGLSPTHAYTGYEAVAGGSRGHVSHVMAAIRNTAIGLLRLAGETNIAAACRRMAAQPERALALIGIKLKTE